jgi:hypothetical protein
MVASLYISYRQDESDLYNRFIVRLHDVFDEEQVLIARDAAGRADLIRTIFNDIDVLVVVIGRQWAKVVSQRESLNRLEIEAAIQRGISVV